MATNFILLRWLGTRMIRGGEFKSAYALALGSKFFVVMGAIWVLLQFSSPHPLGFIVGMMTLFVGIAMASLHLGFRQTSV